MVTRTVVNTGDPVVVPSGPVKAGVALTFQLVDAVKRDPISLFDAAADGGEFIIGEPVVATTNEVGLFTVNLWPNSRGEVATLYKVTSPGLFIKPFYIRVAEGETELTLLAAKAAQEAVQPQVLSLFEALLANILEIVGTATAVVTTTVNGLMSYTDKVKLDAITGTNTGNETATTTGALITGATAKATPVDADTVGVSDSAASNILKKVTWANVKATLKTYFDGIYPPLAGPGAGQAFSVGGITLGNAAASGSTNRVLQYYDEGTWTPVVKFGGSATGVTGTFTGTWTRFGRKVIVDGSVVLTNKGANSGFCTVDGLVHPAASNSLGSIDPIDALAGLTGAVVVGTAGGGATFVYLLMASATSRTPLNETHFTNTSQFRFTLTYTV